MIDTNAQVRMFIADELLTPRRKEEFDADHSSNSLVGNIADRACSTCVQRRRTEERFADATETSEQLMKLFDQAGDTCLRNPSRDVQVTVTCHAMN